MARLAESVIIGARLDCSWDIPPPPDGQTFDKTRVNVRYTASDGSETPYGKVEGECGDRQGWYYDDESAPTKILVCPATCDAIQDDPDARIDIVFGCATVIIE
jgi:hypothetical protein